MKWTLRKYLLKALLTLAAFYVAINLYQSTKHTEQPIRIIQQHEQIADSEYIISEQMIMSKLQHKSQIVSLQQELHKTDTFVEDGFLGERHTQLTVSGSYKMGLNTADIDIQHIDSQNGIIYIKLGKPILISLELPFNDIEFDKTKGWLRLAASEEDEKKFYKSVKANIEHELLADKELMRTADLHNREMISELLKLIPEIKSVVFK